MNKQHPISQNHSHAPSKFHHKHVNPSWGSFGNCSSKKENHLLETSTGIFVLQVFQYHPIRKQGRASSSSNSVSPPRIEVILFLLPMTWPCFVWKNSSLLLDVAEIQGTGSSVKVAGCFSLLLLATFQVVYHFFQYGLSQN